MTTTGSGTPNPGLTISIYRVDPRTLERSPAVARMLPASDEPVMTSAYPPCACPHCTGAGAR
ncbi:hypothetical protein [Streptomyces sp. NPDC002889]|uniref:hypothetical protein n=1 Tax=Streptomyces sp. NPDC002889 TaxID=3364669 RepID=UPI0036C042E3